MYLSRVRLKPEIGRNSQLGLLLKDRTYGTHRLLYDLFDASEYPCRREDKGDKSEGKRCFLYREEIANEQVKGADVKGEPIYYLLSMQQPKSDAPLFMVESKPFQPDLQAGQRLAFKLRVNPIVSRNGKRHDLVMDEQIRFYQRICKALDLPIAGHKKELKAQLLSVQSREPVQAWLRDYLLNSRHFHCLSEQPSVKKMLFTALQDSTSQRIQHWLTDSSTRSGVFSMVEQEIENPLTDSEITVPVFEYHGYQSHPIPEKGRGAQFCSVDLSGELIVHKPEAFITLLQQGIGPAKGFGCGLMLIRPVTHFF